MAGGGGGGVGGSLLVIYATSLTPMVYYSRRTENQFLLDYHVDTSTSTGILSEKH